MEITTPLALLGLLNKQKGGTYAIRGFVYQTNYIVWKVLNEFSKSQNDNLVFRPEGVEDLDFYCRISEVTTNEFTQVKCLNNSLNADQFTTDILPNLLKVYCIAPESRFKVISNQHITGGVLGKLKEAVSGKTALQPRTFEHWSTKIRTIENNITDEEIRDFLSKIEFEQRQESDLFSDSLKLLIEHFDVVQGNEKQFHTALFYAVLQWSMYKQEVRKLDFQEVIQATKDERFENMAIRNGWISEVLFEKRMDKSSENAYFEGKPARPYHIAANLPVARPDWEKRITESIQEFDVTVIKSSSGQGKSTLAWQVAHVLKSQRFKVYELLETPTAGLHDLFLFFKSRLKIGIIPLVVIDGLNKRVAEWSELAARVSELRGVKFLVTTREEDWFRYGNMVSRLFLKPINIELNPKEAEAIFQAFRKRDMVHSNMRTWQIAWDEVKSEKLLLEFVYLLTQGKMIRERLADQLDLMHQEPENHAKKAVLRLVALADVLNLRLPTANLARYIKLEIGFGGDRNDLFKSLKDEYHIQVEGTEFTEGLHPVRSKHLTDLLHEATPLSETLTELAPLLEAGVLIDFASRSPRLLRTKTEKERFFESLIEKVYEKPYSEILNIVIGIFGSDAHQHWLQNKDIYDKVSTKGLMLYTALKTPFGGLKTSSFDVITKINPDFKKNLEAIKAYNISDSNISFFLKCLQSKLRSSPLKSSLAGALDLERWFERFNISMNLMTKLTVENLKNAIKELDVDSLGQVLRGIFLLNESLYQQVYSKHGSELIIKLLEETNSLQIQPLDSEILKIKYLVDEEQKVHDQSINRLRLIAYCLPFYKTYEIEGVYFPNPFMKMLRTNNEESTKTATWDNWLKYDSFATTANSFWVSIIEGEYEFSTQFEWQEYWFGFRKTFLEWQRQACRVLEAAMGSKRDYNKEEASWRNVTQQILNRQDEQKGIRYDDYFTQIQFKVTVKNVEDWASMSNTIVFQFSKIADENTRRLVQLNAHDLFEKLSGMQTAFDEIAMQTGSYFDTVELVQQEINAHKYFSEITRFYHEEFSTKPRPLFNIRQEVKNRIEIVKKKELKKLEGIKTVFDTALDYELILPNRIIEETYNDSIVLGISEISATEFNQSANSIMANLLGLLDLDASSFYLILIENEIASKNISFRFQKESLRKFKDRVEGKEVELPQPFFLPMPLTPEILQCLPGIHLNQVSEEDTQKGKILLLHKALWEYSETQRSLNFPGCDLLKSQRLKKMAEQIHHHLNLIQPQSTIFKKYQLLVEQVLTGVLKFDETACDTLFWEDMV
jgi:hypothetical protein